MSVSEETIARAILWSFSPPAARWLPNWLEAVASASMAAKVAQRARAATLWRTVPTTRGRTPVPLAFWRRMGEPEPKAWQTVGGEGAVEVVFKKVGKVLVGRVY